MTIKDKTFESLIPHDQLVERIKILASSISTDFEGKDPIVIGVLNGSYLFFSDLTKEISYEVEVAFIRYKSYDGLSSTGKFKISLPIPESAKNRHIIIVEDIVDTGKTLRKILEDVKDFNPKSVSICTMLLKPEVFKDAFEVKYVGFEIPNKFVIGYGLDYDERGRNLKEIMVLSE